MVFTDLGMPGMSGWQVAEEIKKVDPNMPVVLVTGWEVMHKEEEIKKSGVDMVILKPFKLSRIARVIKESLDLRKQNS
jgi:CheY-like chemotaxis protein